MFDYNDLLVAVRQACISMMQTMQLSTFVYGTVMSVAPLKIQVEQKIILTKAQLVLTRNVTDFETEVTVDWTTENKSGGSGDSTFSSHNHAVKGKKKITVHNALQVGEKVVLLKQHGGQKYLVLDRAVNS